MFAICIESSHARGMGHLFRAINLAAALGHRWDTPVILVNEHAPSISVLERHGLRYRVVDLEDHVTNWEWRTIDECGVSIWINDRLDTDARHARRVKASGIPLVTFDDHGDGSEFADLHVAALSFDERQHLGGRQVLCGVEYLILNQDIGHYRRLRSKLGSIVVNLGGSDTYGVTVRVVQALAVRGRSATVVVGPSFEHHKELQKVMTGTFEVKCGVPSLVEEFSHHDLAITGGGITPFEANAAGLPVIVIANESFEIPVGEKLANLGGARFAGFHTDFDERIFDEELPITQMSKLAMEHIGLGGSQAVVAAISELLNDA